MPVTHCGAVILRNSLNREEVQDFMDRNALICMNDGRIKRFDVRTGGGSCIDLALGSSELAIIGEWDNLDSSPIGSDHFPIL